MDETEFDRWLAVLAQAGITPAIVPCKPGTKIPAVKWRDHPAATRTPDWSGTTARAMLTGQRSGGLVVIDVDAGKGGYETLTALEAEFGQLDPLLQVETPTGGLHLYFQDETRFQSNVEELGAGVDIRADGGIVLVPGSVHPKGGIYRVTQ